MTDQAISLSWQCCSFESLTAHQLFDILKLRQDVFVLEQHCLYPDIDVKDKISHHLMGYHQQQLAAYLRIVPPDVSYEYPSLGRVVIAESARQGGCGRQLVAQGIKAINGLYPGQVIRIGAQTYLSRFYQSFGFQAVSEPYDEDGIEHILMDKLP